MNIYNSQLSVLKNALEQWIEDCAGRDSDEAKQMQSVWSILRLHEVFSLVGKLANHITWKEHCWEQFLKDPQDKLDWPEYLDGCQASIEYNISQEEVLESFVEQARSLLVASKEERPESSK